MEPQPRPTPRPSAGKALTAAGVCLLAALAVVMAPACGARTAPAVPDTPLTVGFGIGGTALASALQNLIDTLSAESLVGIGWNGRPISRLASEWGWEENGRVLRLRLRPGATLHDGTTLTAEIVATDLRRQLQGTGFERIQSVQAKGPDQVLVRLAQPDALLLSLLSRALIKTGPERTFGTGPYILRSRKPEVVLDAFSNYHLGQPAISKVVVRTYDTPRGAWAAMLRGDVTFLYELNRDAVEFVEAGSRIQTFSFPRPYYIPIIFNVRHPILGRRDVRQAINEAIDRAQIVKTALNDRGQPATGPIWPYHWSYNAAAKGYTYNPEAARLRLDASGLRLVAPGGGQMPRRFRFRCLFYSEDALFERIALVVQKQLFEVGVDVEMVPMTLSALMAPLGSGDFDAVMLPMTSGRSLEWTYLFWRSVPETEKATVRSGYHAADAALDRMRAAQSEDETRGAVAELQRIMYDDPPAAFLVRPETARAVDDSFVVPVEERSRDILGSTIWQWKRRETSQAQSRK